MGNDNTKDIKPDIQENAGRMPDGTFPPGVSGNPAGRPKRKTLTELIHAKLDDTPQAWDAIVAMVIQKILTDKDKDVLKALWQYTDGMPVQKQVLSGDEESPIKVDIGATLMKVYGQSNKNSPRKVSARSKKSGSAT